MTIIKDLKKAREWIDQAASLSREIRADPDLTRDDILAFSRDATMRCEEAEMCISRALDNLGAKD